MKLYVEGGGDSNELKTACRKGFSEFFKKAGLKGSMPRIVACGGRENAYESFCTAIKSGEQALLLVDSEAAISPDCQKGDTVEWKPWSHLQYRDGDQWDKPATASDEDCHFMVQCMEAWFLADRKTLKDFFGLGFNSNQLPAETRGIESLSKDDIYRSLRNATKNCETKAAYSKGEHSFKILEKTSPDLVVTASPWAKRFIDILKAKMGCQTG